MYLAGRVRVERGDALIDEVDLPGRQGRLLLALLVAERGRSLSRDQLADELWGASPPAAWDVALRALVSKLRRVLEGVGLAPEALSHGPGGYQLHLPVTAWVDTEAAGEAVHAAETALARGRADEAYGWAYVGYHITGRSFLNGEEGPWVRRFRSRLQTLRLRALDCVVVCSTANGELAEAVRAAEDALEVDPLREATYQRYMQALASAGARVEALRVWERCRQALDEEIGVRPSAQTEAVYLEILRS